jgi:PIN domain nuclease of toxin-antitoxin system
MLLLDTHILLWWTEARSIAPSIHEQIEEARGTGTLFVSAATAWEIGILTAKSQYQLPRPVLEWWRLLVTVGGVRQVPIDGEIALLSWQLPGTIHQDPGDRLIVASAMARQLTLVTRDRKLIEYCQQQHIHVLSA